LQVLIAKKAATEEMADSK